MKELRGKKTAVPNGVSENGVLAADLAAEAGKQAMQYQVCGHVPSRTPGLARPVTWPRGKAQGGRTPEWGEGWEAVVYKKGERGLVLFRQIFTKSKIGRAHV